MRKNLLFLLILQVVMAGWCFAGEFDAGLTVSNTSLVGSVHYKKQMMNGYWKAGGAGVYADKDNMNYKWLELDYRIGNDLLHPGLIIEAGFKGILGDGEMDPYSGDIGALAFSGRVGYLFPTVKTFIPIEIYGDISYAPQILSFRDNDNYFAYSIVLGFHIVDNATLLAGYHAYDVDMESGPGEWTLYDNQFRFGLQLVF